MQPETPSQAPISLNWGRAEARERGPGGREGLGAAGAQARPGQLGEGIPAGKRKLGAPILEGKPQNPSVRLSQKARQPGLIPDPARLPGPRSSAAPPPRPPHPGSPSQRRRGVACRKSREEPEPEPTPQRTGAGRRSGTALGGGTAPASPPRDSRRFWPASAFAARGPPRGPARRPGPGGRPLCARVALRARCVRRAPSAGLSVCPAPSVRVCPAAALWALDAAHGTPHWRGPRALSGPRWRCASSEGT